MAPRAGDDAGGYVIDVTSIFRGREKRYQQIDLGVTGDPKAYLNKKQVKTVAELLDDAWETYLKKLPSAEAAGIARDILKREMGDKRLSALVLRDYDDFRDKLKAAGKAIGYVSRILSVLRSSANRALENKQTTVKLKVPEYQPRSKKKGLKKKGPLLTCPEIAAITGSTTDAARRASADGIRTLRRTYTPAQVGGGR